MATKLTATTNQFSARSNVWLNRPAFALVASWLWLLTWWVAVNYTRLKIAETLVDQEGLERGAPLTDNDHLSQFPELHAEFEALGLLGQGMIMWIFMLCAFAVAGLVISIVVAFSDLVRKKEMVVGMAVAWSAGAVLALANGRTLDLLSWLNN